MFVWNFSVIKHMAFNKCELGWNRQPIIHGFTLHDQCTRHHVFTSVVCMHACMHAWASCQICKIAVAHALGMPGTFSPIPLVSDPDMHHGTCGTHVPWCTPRSLTTGFLWSLWRGKCSRHSRRMRNWQYNVTGKRSIHACVYVCKNGWEDRVGRRHYHTLSCAYQWCSGHPCVQHMWNPQVKGQVTETHRLKIKPLWHSFVSPNVWYHNGATIGLQ